MQPFWADSLVRQCLIVRMPWINKGQTEKNVVSPKKKCYVVYWVPWSTPGTETCDHSALSAALPHEPFTFYWISLVLPCFLFNFATL